jgi:predicted CXXCH cytochrome family protein
MTAARAQDPGEWRRLQRLLSACVAAALLFVAVFYGLYWRSGIGQVQPIPFSHRFHAGEKRISCLMCHADVTDTRRAGVPPLQTCMLCHERIAVTYPAIEDLRSHYFNNDPVTWEKVTILPDFVYYDHDAHIQKGFDCSKCHGDVKSMDRIVLVEDIRMGFCVQCHRDNNASHDCFTCHR